MGSKLRWIFTGLVLASVVCLAAFLLANRPRIRPTHDIPDRDIVFAVAGTNTLGFVNADGTGYTTREINMGLLRPYVAGGTKWSQDGGSLVTRHNPAFGSNPYPGDPLLISLEGDFLSCQEFYGQGDVWGVGGTRVVVSDVDTDEVYLVDMATCQKLETLYRSPFGINHMAISPLGWLALIEGRELVIVNAAGEEVFRQMEGAGTPAWSRDGEWLAYYHEDAIYIMGKDGTEQRLLAGGGSSPSWSPDGRWIAYHDGRAILKANVATGELVKLVEGGQIPSWRWREGE